MHVLLHNPTAPLRLGYVELQRLSNEELMCALKAGSHDALAVLFDRFHRRVFSIALTFVGDRAEAEDVMQVVFLELFRNISQYDPSKSNVETLLLRAAVHEAVIRRKQLATD